MAATLNCPHLFATKSALNSKPGIITSNCINSKGLKQLIEVHEKKDGHRSVSIHLFAQIESADVVVFSLGLFDGLCCDLSP